MPLAATEEEKKEKKEGEEGDAEGSRDFGNPFRRSNKNECLRPARPGLGLRTQSRDLLQERAGQWAGSLTVSARPAPSARTALGR